ELDRGPASARFFLSRVSVVSAAGAASLPWRLSLITGRLRPAFSFSHFNGLGRGRGIIAPAAELDRGPARFSFSNQANRPGDRGIAPIHGTIPACPMPPFLISRPSGTVVRI